MPAETVAIVKTVQAYNDTASAVTVTMSFTDTSASTTYNIGYASSSAIEQFELLTSNLLVLEESDILILTASVADSSDWCRQYSRTGSNVMTTVKVNGKDIPVINAKVITTIKNKKTGAIYKDEDEWKTLKIPCRRHPTRCLSQDTKA